MPVRILFYLVYALENYLKEKNIFRKSRIKIPEIRFYVLFTGITEKPIEQLKTIQRLSDAYLSQKREEIGKKEKKVKTKEKLEQRRQEEKDPLTWNFVFIAFI